MTSCRPRSRSPACPAMSSSARQCCRRSIRRSARCCSRMRPAHLRHQPSPVYPARPTGRSCQPLAAPLARVVVREYRTMGRRGGGRRGRQSRSGGSRPCAGQRSRVMHMPPPRRSSGRKLIGHGAALGATDGQLADRLRLLLAPAPQRSGVVSGFVVAVAIGLWRRRSDRCLPGPPADRAARDQREPDRGSLSP